MARWNVWILLWGILFIETMTLQFNSLKTSNSKGACYLISLVTLLLATYSVLVCFGWRHNSKLPGFLIGRPLCKGHTTFMGYCWMSYGCTISSSRNLSGHRSMDIATWRIHLPCPSSSSCPYPFLCEDADVCVQEIRKMVQVKINFFLSFLARFNSTKMRSLITAQLHKCLCQHKKEGLIR